MDACSPFIYVENLVREDDKGATELKPKKKTRNELRGDTSLVRLLRNAADQSAGDDGWSHLGKVGDYIHNNNSSFSVINYGYKRLGDLIRASELFEIEMARPCTSAIFESKPPTWLPPEKAPPHKVQGGQVLLNACPWGTPEKVEFPAAKLSYWIGSMMRRGGLSSEKRSTKAVFNARRSWT